MASSIIHMAIAKKINKNLKRNEKQILIGSIAPDISKIVDEPRYITHFADKEDSIPDIEKFLKKYKDKLNDDFVLGYYIHLLTDYLWQKFFLTEITNKNFVKKINGDTVKLNGHMLLLYIYNDYTNLNIELIKKYNLDFEFMFQEENQYIPKIIEEIPYEKLSALFDNFERIIENSKTSKAFVFDLENIDNFIDLSEKIILSEIDKVLQKKQEI